MDFRDHALPITPPVTPVIDGDAPVTPLIETYWLEDADCDDELPMSREDVDKLCGTRPPTIKLKYLTLRLKPLQRSDSVAETIKAIEAQKSWERAIKDWFVANQYKVVESQNVETGFYWSFERGLERFARFVPGCNDDYQAFQIRSELRNAAPTSRLSLDMLVFSPVPKCERAAALPFEE